MGALIHSHSGLRWIALVLLLVAVVMAFSGWKGKKPFAKSHNMITLFAFVTLHIQLLLGFILYFAGPKTAVAFQSASVMGDSFARFWVVEHLAGMLVGIVFVTMGRVRMKKLTDDTQKHKFIFVYYLIGLAIILVSIPWPFRNVGGGLF